MTQGQVARGRRVWDNGDQDGRARVKDGVMDNVNDLPASNWTADLGRCIQGYMISTTKVRLSGYAYSPTTAGHAAGSVMDTRAVTYSYTSTGSAVSDQGQEHRVEVDDADRYRDDHGLEREGDARRTRGTLT